MVNSSIAIHFSGGSDSTLCAALAAEKFDTVHLLTYDRISFVGAKRYTEKNYSHLVRVYGAGKFIRKIISIEALHKRICYHDYLAIARRFGTVVTALTFSKLSMHWASAMYARKHGVGSIADGSVPYMAPYPDQNEKIALGSFRDFYGAWGIEYENPVWNIHDDVEQILFDKGISELPEIRGTEQDYQVFYLEQVLLALFLKYYLTRHGFERYEEKMGDLYRERIDFISRSLLFPPPWLRRFQEVL